MKKIFTYFTLLFFVTSSVSAQRYLTEVFTQVQVTDNITYGQNYSILTGAPQLQTLEMSVYEPMGDTATQRPLFIYLHTGNFLPKGLNQSPTGNLKDSATVEICTRLAKQGYVVAAISYRLGWNPAPGTTQETRTGTLLRAVYRALQDTRTAVRYFKKDVATNGNVFKINKDKIGVIGQGSGGYVALATASLDKMAEIQLSKFIDFTDITNPVLYVDTAIWGNFEGFGGNSSLNVSNHVGYSSEIQFCMNIGGALGDSSWLEAGDVPMVSFHCKTDPFAPYGNGAVIVPTTQEFVVDVSGSRTVQNLANQYQNNDVFKINIYDAYTVQANMYNEGFEGLYPFVTSNVQSAPWEWWDPADAKHSNGLLTNPDMSKTKANAYIDTIIGYMSPRAYVVMVDPTYIGIEALQNQSPAISVFPNPNTGSMVQIKSKENLLNIDIYNIAGQFITSVPTPKTNNYALDLKGLEKGVYFLSIATEKGKEVTKLLVD